MLWSKALLFEFLLLASYLPWAGLGWGPGWTCDLAFLFRFLLLFFFFFFLCLRRQNQKNIATIYVKEFLVCVFFSELYFKFLSHFQLIFVYGVRQWSSFLLLHMVAQFFQSPFIEECSFPKLTFLWGKVHSNQINKSMVLCGGTSDQSKCF